MGDIDGGEERWEVFSDTTVAVRHDAGGAVVRNGVANDSRKSRRYFSESMGRADMSLGSGVIRSPALKVSLIGRTLIVSSCTSAMMDFREFLD